LKLSELIKAVEVEQRLNFEDIALNGISTDSRTIAEGDLFVAVKGHSVDGHDYLNEAIGRGASALVVERPVQSQLPVIVVRNGAVAAALMAKAFYGDPDAALLIVGITGTNGKTSTAFLVQSILELAAGKTGIIGTVGFGLDDELVAATHTTPASVDLYRIMAEFRDRGCRAVVMEVSSHATDQGRITGIEFDVGVFTNITREHLDYHGTFEDYAGAKEKLAVSLLLEGRKKEPGVLVYNADDAPVAAIAGRFKGRKVSYGLGSGHDICAEKLEADLGGTRFELVARGERTPIDLKLLGTFSAYNALAAAAAAHMLGAKPPEIKRGLEKIREVPGRFQVVRRDGGPVVIVDYAHTPDALESLLRFCRQLEPDRIVTIFGCGGDRDRGKRPLMGGIACLLSDIVFVTDDNPRTEDPGVIIAEILSGIEDPGIPVHVQHDRRTAIRAAVGEAGRADLVVIAGKGHESVQIVGDRRIPFSDAEEAIEALRIAEVDLQG
jgi:UDP-N-acetylmuramoyl-L-alanyl-D-glutamate--2,6-diaminopimelate ligase